MGAGFTLSAPLLASPTSTVQTSVSGQHKGSLYLAHTSSAGRDSGSTTGTLSHDAAPFGAQLALGLNLNDAPDGTRTLTGRGDLTLNYAGPALDVSASARYGCSVATTAEASYRYGLGLRCRFPDKESP